jgi:flagella synthesis protein FlgN
MTTSGNNPANSLQEETRTARSLLELLKKEQEQLIAADIDAISALTEEKSKLVAQLSELATRRYNALASAGYDAQESGMQAWLKNQPNPGISQSWKELIGFAQAAKEANRVNGLLIGKHLTRNQQALNVLKGGAQGQTFYGPNGQSSVKTTVRGLAIG